MWFTSVPTEDGNVGRCKEEEGEYIGSNCVAAVLI